MRNRGSKQITPHLVKFGVPLHVWNGVIDKLFVLLGETPLNETPTGSPRISGAETDAEQCRSPGIGIHQAQSVASTYGRAPTLDSGSLNRESGRIFN